MILVAIFLGCHYYYFFSESLLRHRYLKAIGTESHFPGLTSTPFLLFSLSLITVQRSHFLRSCRLVITHMPAWCLIVSPVLFLLQILLAMVSYYKSLTALLERDPFKNSLEGSSPNKDYTLALRFQIFHLNST